jgi:hypothetical protein
LVGVRVIVFVGTGVALGPPAVFVGRGVLVAVLVGVRVGVWV